jgi:hypothetical protein
MSDVFISYSEDSERDAELLSRALHDKGLSTWASHKDLRAGNVLMESIWDTVKHSKIAVFFISPKSTQSKWQQMEYMAALDSWWADPSKAMLPIVIGEATPPSFLRDQQMFKIKNRKRDLPRAAEWVVKVLDQKNYARSNRSVEKEREDRFKALERDVYVLKDQEGRYLLREAKEYLRETHRDANSPAVEFLNNHFRSRFDGPRTGARRRKSKTRSSA